MVRSSKITMLYFRAVTVFIYRRLGLMKEAGHN
jgi:hypothetical protein